MESGNVVGAVSVPRTTRFMMEGVGARVIRGPDWKWGKQVSSLFTYDISQKTLFQQTPVQS